MFFRTPSLGKMAKSPEIIKKINEIKKTNMTRILDKRKMRDELQL